MFPIDSIMIPFCFLLCREICPFYCCQHALFKYSLPHNTMTIIFSWISTDSAPRSSTLRIRMYSFKPSLSKWILKDQMQQHPTLGQRVYKLLNCHVTEEKTDKQYHNWILWSLSHWSLSQCNMVDTFSN